MGLDKETWKMVQIENAVDAIMDEHCKQFTQQAVRGHDARQDFAMKHCVPVRLAHTTVTALPRAKSQARVCHAQRSMQIT